MGSAKALRTPRRRLETPALRYHASSLRRGELTRDDRVPLPYRRET
ncbi:MAG: hypothetical protein KGJ57_19640 [Sphingomonadales bacterium]|nr:hypothetical protein [Sphingomonadales bacterium]MDE2171608.1 hypothetical protein [Sphingomonadales bacterium]